MHGKNEKLLLLSTILENWLKLKRPKDTETESKPLGISCQKPAPPLPQCD
jgi:hypothetical protein